MIYWTDVINLFLITNLSVNVAYLLNPGQKPFFEWV